MSAPSRPLVPGKPGLVCQAHSWVQGSSHGGRTLGWCPGAEPTAVSVEMEVWAFVELVLGLAGLVCLTSQALSSWQIRHFMSP